MCHATISLPILKIKQDIPTRRYSTFDMLHRIVQVKDTLISTLALLRPDLNIKHDDRIIIQEVLPLLKPFYEVTKCNFIQSYCVQQFNSRFFQKTCSKKSKSYFGKICSKKRNRELVQRLGK